MSEETALVPAQSGEVAAPAPKKVKRIIRKKRPARVCQNFVAIRVIVPPQCDSTAKSEPPPQTGVVYNVWYNKWSGGLCLPLSCLSICLISEFQGIVKTTFQPPRKAAAIFRTIRDIPELIRSLAHIFVFSSQYVMQHSLHMQNADCDPKTREAFVPTGKTANICTDCQECMTFSIQM
ncbi:hypothetical protein RRF57_006924 [Xylaria bambusicola]|uniref:Uncharacterized protein n=1 Tax=Xylaria bambusicola TaxID=326684 RepID=A0AAN7UFC9_9PEZI